MPTFSDLGVPADVASVLAKQGITEPFPIQIATLPDSIAGRDVLGRGRTGSGKTLAFCLPIISSLRNSSAARKNQPRSLILVPTRELAQQVQSTLRPLADKTGLTTTVVVGGVSYNPQIKDLRAGVDILVATPGRLEDLIKQGHCRLDAVEITVLDEADHLADLGFLPAVKRLLDATPASGQRMLFSATLDGAVGVIVRRYLTNPVTHHVDSENSEVPTLDHYIMTVREADKMTVVHELVGGEQRTLAFTRTKHAAKRLAKNLTAAGIPALDLHGDLSQAARQKNLAAFGRGHVRVLVATDVAARGIHVDDIGLVVQVDAPAEHKSYLHRCGRTARAGASGTVITLGTARERRNLQGLMRRAAVDADVHHVEPGAEIISELVGPQTARRTMPVIEQPRNTGGGGNRNRGNGRGARPRYNSSRGQR